MELFDLNALECCKITTNNYSTSFSLGVRMLNYKYRWPIYALYGFVRYADEIVDTLHQFDKKKLITDFKTETWKAIHSKVSVNPILHGFQLLVNQYQIEHDHIEAFLKSMEFDLNKTTYTRDEYHEYIYGSAEVIGLMCLRVFYAGNDNEYEKLKPYARKLGEAFQKINFLRDLSDDYLNKGRMYFPGIDFNHFSEENKKDIETEINSDFNSALTGIRLLQPKVRLGVYLAYMYYKTLFAKIKKTKASEITRKRLRINNFYKFIILISATIRHNFNWL